MENRTIYRIGTNVLFQLFHLSALLSVLISHKFSVWHAQRIKMPVLELYFTGFTTWNKMDGMHRCCFSESKSFTVIKNTSDKRQCQPASNSWFTSEFNSFNPINGRGTIFITDVRTDIYIYMTGTNDLSQLPIARANEAEYGVKQLHVLLSHIRFLKYRTNRATALKQQFLKGRIFISHPRGRWLEKTSLHLFTVKTWRGNAVLVEANMSDSFLAALILRRHEST
jgi:hypothetical protein